MIFGAPPSGELLRMGMIATRGPFPFSSLASAGVTATSRNARIASGRNQFVRDISWLPRAGQSKDVETGGTHPMSTTAGTLGFVGKVARPGGFEPPTF